MILLADIVLNPGGLVAWLAVGLVAGWLASRVLRSAGYGLIGDFIVGLIGAFIGGFIFGSLQSDYAVGSTGFWGSVLVAFLGALLLLVGVRFLTARQSV